METRVFKFGGASVKDSSGIRNVAKIIQEYALPSGQVIVVSAMGKTTNALENLLELAINGKDYSNELAVLASAHYQTAEELFSDSADGLIAADGLRGHFDALNLLLSEATRKDQDYLYDQVVSLGEYLSSCILFHYLKKNGYPVSLLEAPGVIRTDANWREGEVDMEHSSFLVKEGLVPLLKDGNVLTQGFIGGTADGMRTTLGREGSDYTAALLAFFLGTESVSIWKDVPGVLNADPAWMPDAVLLPELSYQDAAELTYYGATVIHPKTIRPLARKKIPLFVRSFLHPELPGTIVGPEGKRLKQESWIRKRNQVLVSISSRDFSFMEEKNIRELLQAFSEAGLRMQMLQVSATSISVVTDGLERRLEKVLAEISSSYSVLFNHKLTLITVLNPGPLAAEYRLNGNSPFLLQKTRSSLQMLFQEI